MCTNFIRYVENCINVAFQQKVLVICFVLFVLFFHDYLYLSE